MKNQNKKNLMEKYSSDKLTVLSFSLCLMIIVLHSNPINSLGLNLNDYTLVYWINGVCQMAVPMFFYISAYLFFRTFCKEKIVVKYKSRIKTLVIPYLLWNLIFTSLFFILLNIPWLSDKMNMSLNQNTPLEFIQAVFLSKYTPLWFVGNLIAYVALAPVILLLLQNKVVSVFVILISAFFTLFIGGDNINIPNWFIYYFIGAFIGYNFHNSIEHKHNIKGKTVISLSVLFVAVYVSSVVYNQYFYYRLLSPVFVWILYDFVVDRVNVRPWMSDSFFLYCTHFFCINVFQKLFILFFPELGKQWIGVYFIYILTPIVIIPLLLIFAEKCKSYRVYGIFTGGR